MCQPAQRVKEAPVGSQDPASPHRTTRADRASNKLKKKGGGGGVCKNEPVPLVLSDLEKIW